MLNTKDTVVDALLETSFFFFASFHVHVLFIILILIRSNIEKKKSDRFNYLLPCAFSLL